MRHFMEKIRFLCTGQLQEITCVFSLSRCTVRYAMTSCRIWKWRTELFYTRIPKRKRMLHSVGPTSEYFPRYFPRLLSTLIRRCNSCSLERVSAPPGASSASLSMSDGGSYDGVLAESFSAKGVRESRDELRTRLSLEGERNRFSARLAPLRIKDSMEGTLSCSFWANDCVSSLCWDWKTNKSKHIRRPDQDNSHL